MTVILDGNGAAGNEAQITLKLTNVPLVDAFRYTADLAGFELKVEPHAVVLSRIAEHR